MRLVSINESLMPLHSSALMHVLKDHDARKLRTSLNMLENAIGRNQRHNVALASTDFELLFKWRGGWVT